MKKVVWLIIVMVLVSGLEFTFLDGSCKQPLPWQKKACQEMEQAILDSTVRIVFHGWLDVENGYEVERIWGSISHATVIDGRFLVTHNHFGLPLSQVQSYNRNANGRFDGVSIFEMDGTAVLDHAPMDIFKVLVEEKETVVLDFGTIEGEGFFTQAGIRSAEISPIGEIKLSPGDEVAQIDWDGKGNAKVLWSEIAAVYDNNGLQTVLVDNYIEHGASGGGLFMNGKHIGNNWAHLIQTDLDTNTTHPRSLVALNTNTIMGLIP